MDSSTLKRLIHTNYHLLPVFAGVWSADNFPKQPVLRSHQTVNHCGLEKKSDCIDTRLAWFQIINTSPLMAPGRHWILVGATSTGCGTKKVFVWDCLGQPLSKHKKLFLRLERFYGRSGYTEIILPLQNTSSNMCGLYCLFLIQYIAKKPFELSQIDTKLKHVTEIDIVRFINNQYKTLFRYTIV